MNPWLSIWLRPRATMRSILDTDPERLVILLACVGGIAETLGRASMRNAGDKLSLPAVLLASLAAGPVAGLISLYLGGLLLRWTGGWLGGRGTAVHLRAAIAWSQVIPIWAMLVWVPQLLLFGREMFTRETPRIDESTALTLLFFGLGLVDLVLGVWGFVVLLKCIGEAQGFSAWRALGNVLLAILVVLVPLLVLILVIVLAVKTLGG